MDCFTGRGATWVPFSGSSWLDEPHCSRSLGERMTVTVTSSPEVGQPVRNFCMTWTPTTMNSVRSVTVTQEYFAFVRLPPRSGASSHRPLV